MFQTFLTSLVIIGLFFSSQISTQTPPDILPFPQKVLSASVETVDTFVSIPRQINPASLGVEITAQSALVIDKESSAVLFSKNSIQALPLASITKLMTALVFLDQSPEWENSIVITAQDQIRGNIVYLYPGEEVSIKSIFDVMLIASSNEAAVALVRASGLGMEEFIALMNKKAGSLGLGDTIFFDTTGLDARNISSVTDIVRLSRAAYSRTEISETANIETYNIKIVNVGATRIAYSTDKLLQSFLNDESLGYKINGAKTGFLNEVGYNMATEIVKDGHSIYIATLGSTLEDDRWQDVKALADWVFRNFQWPDSF